jgi:hypothetical protein
MVSLYMSSRVADKLKIRSQEHVTFVETNNLQSEYALRTLNNPMNTASWKIKWILSHRFKTFGV